MILFESSLQKVGSITKRAVAQDRGTLSRTPGMTGPAGTLLFSGWVGARTGGTGSETGSIRHLRASRALSSHQSAVEALHLGCTHFHHHCGESNLELNPQWQILTLCLPKQSEHTDMPKIQQGIQPTDGPPVRNFKREKATCSQSS